MVQERETGTYEITTDGDTVTDPALGEEFVSITVAKTAYVTKLTVASDNGQPINVDVDGETRVPVTSGSNDTVDLSGDVTNPIAKVPAGSTVKVVAPESGTGRVGASVTLQELAN